MLSEALCALQAHQQDVSTNIFIFSKKTHKTSLWSLPNPQQPHPMPCQKQPRSVTTRVLTELKWSYLHDGTELRFVLHLLFCHPPLDTGQNTGFEEVPPVVMEDSEKQLK